MAKRVELEGIDGSSKSTSLTYLADQLEKKGYRVLRTMEVGSQHVPFAAKLREMTLNPENNLMPTTMEFLFAAMRVESDRYYNSVRDDYDYIVSDRGMLSHLAYSDASIGEEFTDRFFFKLVKDLTTMPNYVLYFKINPETAFKRMKGRGEPTDAVEARGVKFQEDVKAAFEVHIRNPNLNVTTINAELDIEGVQKQIDTFIAEVLKA